MLKIVFFVGTFIFHDIFTFRLQMYAVLFDVSVLSFIFGNR